MKNAPLAQLSLRLFILIMLSQSVFAQQTRRHFQADYDAKAVKFGYFLGLTNTYFNVKFNNYFVNKDNYYGITSPPTFGIKMGGLANIRLNDYFDFRVLPTVAIYGRRLEYHYINVDLAADDPNKFGEKTELRETAWFEIPLMFKYKSERRGNVRMYVFGGLRYGVETNAVNRRRRQQFATKGNDFSIEYGTGIEFFREYFKFAPEIHFSHGLHNLVDPVNNIGTPLAGVDKLTTHTITLYVLFE
ncbi:hypothetical protein EMA8858_02569 [Emticicia aquatica]|jgi:hypothetical protein|uniref:Outer membrane protein beta-barrel domain-containing protein n=1 Tax=Emticicia aquatica TaxID=1681835 RepID=A0ABM9ARC2_9BACT|nr:porin family protein [Emticicia aquatica]CAH0996437.1 hypothetical protein EMA8858_02569 [Emticicia aquatica]